MIADNRDFDDDDDDDPRDDDLRSDLSVESQYDDDDFEDNDWEDDELEEDDQEDEGLDTPRRSKKRKRVFCSHCNRMEAHKRDRRKSTLRSFITGLTFGLNLLFGRIQCVCCGNYRWKYRLMRPKKK